MTFATSIRASIPSNAKLGEAEISELGSVLWRHVTTSLDIFIQATKLPPAEILQVAIYAVVTVSLCVMVSVKERFLTDSLQRVPPRYF